MQVNVAGLRRNIKNLAHNYSDAQVKVREATSNDPWGPSATIMADIADLTYNVVAFSEIMQMIWKRLSDHGKNWRHVYKALILLEYLIKTGTEKVAQQCKENIFAIHTLREFVYFEEGKDQGTHVREKAKQLANLLKDDERLKNERVKALKAKERFAQHPSGFGSDGYVDGPTQRDMPPGWQEEPTKPVSELELVRPQTAGEEELQLQLAMAMSREEAEQEEAKRRSDDVRLQLALSQSEQDFKQQKNENEESKSHLLDLLDISLGAISISSPVLEGEKGGVTSHPEAWNSSADTLRNQLSDPWASSSITPPMDPWQPAIALRPASQMGILNNSVAAPTVNTTSADAWGMSTQSPLITPALTSETWVETSGITNTNNPIGTTTSTNPWVPKTLNANAMDSLIPATARNQTSAVTAAIKPLNDPWVPKTDVNDNSPEAIDPWKNTDKILAKAINPSLELDEFDIITNRNQTSGVAFGGGNAAITNSQLLNELDPLSTENASSIVLRDSGSTAKRRLKDPQAFLGENSSLVNLDNLIKPVVQQTTTAHAATYNPFSDLNMPAKANFFQQQQQQPLPSINELKQQQPFNTTTLIQDPWEPSSNASITRSKNNNVDWMIKTEGNTVSNPFLS